MALKDQVLSLSKSDFLKGRARYRPIDDRTHYWANLFLDEVW